MIALIVLFLSWSLLGRRISSLRGSTGLMKYNPDGSGQIFSIRAAVTCENHRKHLWWLSPDVPIKKGQYPTNWSTKLYCTWCLELP
ncbi:hypothetical protein LOK49_LG10G02350 [Camellia lanceoleosa]|uniref:Uncharacterized protein n=1 Tax=Camellia lanceoleosa TaxID=1840588 RepID=A0ACC0G9Q0_9ERIC|nr:hypothetical protein LOK49_LG10G02350 [Camellia lanceoleosa]